MRRTDTAARPTQQRAALVSVTEVTVREDSGLIEVNTRLDTDQHPTVANAIAHAFLDRLRKEHIDRVHRKEQPLAKTRNRLLGRIDLLEDQIDALSRHHANAEQSADKDKWGRQLESLKTELTSLRGQLTAAEKRLDQLRIDSEQPDAMGAKLITRARQ